MKLLNTVVFWLTFIATLVLGLWYLGAGFGEYPWMIWVLLIAALYPIWRFGIGFKNEYIPFIVGAAERRESDGKCLEKKWVYYNEYVFWGFMAPFSAILWALSAWFPGIPSGWLFVIWWVCFFLVRQIVEGEIDEDNVWRFVGAVGTIVAVAIASSFRFQFNPLKHFHDAAIWMNGIVEPRFYGVAAGVFLGTTLLAIVTAWMFNRAKSDGTYYWRYSLFGMPKRERMYSRGIEIKVKDLLESALTAISFVIHFDKKDEKPMLHPVVFFASTGRGNRDFQDLLEHETPDERRARLGNHYIDDDRPEDPHSPGAGEVDDGDHESDVDDDM